MKKLGMIFAAAWLWALMGCGDDDKKENNAGATACEKTGIFLMDATKRYCDKNKSCEICQNFSEEDIGFDEALKCEEGELNVANACLKNQTQCEKCLGMMMEAQCSPKMLSPQEMTECLPLLGDWMENGALNLKTERKHTNDRMSLHWTFQLQPMFF